jgi:DNA polymerase-3 subunit epsilon
MPEQLDLALDRDLCFFDIEATGLNVIRDRIVQIGIVKYFADGRQPAELYMLINPGVPISEEALAVHGISHKDVANKPTFQQVATKIYDFIGNSDLAGYNSNRFDIPMLMEEFDRVGIHFDISKRKTVDIQRIFYKMEPRTLKAALRYYCNEDMPDAHDALADVRATIQVFVGQLDRYKGVDYIDDDGKMEPAPIKRSIAALHDFTNDLRFVDATQRLKYDVNGVMVFNFGKYVGQAVTEVFKKDKQYYGWMMSKEFSAQVKQIISAIHQQMQQDKPSS